MYARSHPAGKCTSFQARIPSVLTWLSSSGDASLSPDGRHLAISNLDSGFDVYQMEDGIPICSFEHEAPEPEIVPVRFIHGGHAIIGGSSVGRVCAWDIFLKKKLFVLSMPSKHAH